MAGIFKIKSITDLNEATIGTELPESDFCTLTPSGKFVQLSYHEEEKGKRSVTIKPGIWSIGSTPMGLTVKKTSFTNDRILETFLSTKNVTDKVDCFFRRLDVYKEFGIEIPKRAMLLYGPAGSGKSSTISKICQKYSEMKDVAVILWKTDKHDPYEVKLLFKNAAYEGVEKLIIVGEDLGGVEVDQSRIKSESSLLALLDNQEKALTIPTFILLTTNFPENFLANLMDRPGRIDDKVEVGYPDKVARVSLLKFFARDAGLLSDDLIDYVSSKPCEQFTPAHLKEIFLRAGIYDLSLLEATKLIAKDVESYKNAFSKRQALGIRRSEDLD